MKLSIVLGVFILATIYCNVQGLECGIDNSSTQKDLHHIAEKCMKKNNKEEKKTTIDDDDDDDDEAMTTSTETYKKPTKRNKRSENSTRNISENSNNDEYKNENITNNANNTSTQKDNCIVHCIFEHLGMVDNEGFPIHHRVLNALLNNARGRELRDFVQDTTDECFQLMEQGAHQEPCQYSVTLINCLSERGKSSCADWPVGNLPFLTKKN